MNLFRNFINKIYCYLLFNYLNLANKIKIIVSNQNKKISKIKLFLKMIATNMARPGLT